MSLNTRAKFFISKVTLLPGTQGVLVEATAVSRGDRNANWSTATPSGTLTMTVNNPVAADQYIEFMRESRTTGKNPEVFLDIYPSEDGWAGDGHEYRESEILPGNYGSDACGICGFKKDQKLGGGAESHPNG